MRAKPDGKIGSGVEDFYLNVTAGIHQCRRSTQNYSLLATASNFRGRRGEWKNPLLQEDSEIFVRELLRNEQKKEAGLGLPL